MRRDALSLDLSELIR